MPDRLQTPVFRAFQLCLDDEKLCPRGPIPVTISSLSGAGLAVLMLNNQARVVDPAALELRGGEGRALHLTARIGGRSIGLTAQLVWSEPAGPDGGQIELIVDTTNTSDWPAVVAAYDGAA